MASIGEVNSRGQLLTNPPPHLQGNLTFYKASKFRGTSSRLGFFVLLKTVLHQYSSERSFQKGQRHDSEIHLEKVCGIAGTLVSGKYKNSSFKLTLDDREATELLFSAETKQAMERWVSGLKYAKEFWMQYSKRQEFQKMNESLQLPETDLSSSGSSTHMKENACEDSVEQCESIAQVRVTTWDGVRHKVLLPHVFDKEELFSATTGKLQGAKCLGCPTCRLQHSSMEVWIVTEKGQGQRIDNEGGLLDVSKHGQQFYLLVHNYKLLIVHFEDEAVEVIPCLVSVKAKEVPHLPVLADKLCSLGRDNIGLFLVNEIGTSILFAPEEEPLRLITQGKLSLRSKALNVQVPASSGSQNVQTLYKDLLKKVQHHRHCQKALKMAEQQQCQQHSSLATTNAYNEDVAQSSLVFCEEHFNMSDIELKQSIELMYSTTDSKQEGIYTTEQEAAGGTCATNAICVEDNSVGDLQVQPSQGSQIHLAENSDSGENNGLGFTEREMHDEMLESAVQLVETDEGLLVNVVSLEDNSAGELQVKPSHRTQLHQTENSGDGEEGDHGLAEQGTHGWMLGYHWDEAAEGSLEAGPTLPSEHSLAGGTHALVQRVEDISRTNVIKLEIDSTRDSNSDLSSTFRGSSVDAEDGALQVPNNFVDRDDGSRQMEECTRTGTIHSRDTILFPHDNQSSAVISGEAFVSSSDKGGQAQQDTAAYRRSTEDTNVQSLDENDDGDFNVCIIPREDNSSSQTVKDVLTENSGAPSNSKGIECATSQDGQSITTGSFLSTAAHVVESGTRATGIDESTVNTDEAEHCTLRGNEKQVMRKDRCPSCEKRASIKRHRCDYYIVGSPRVLRLVLKMFPAASHNANEEEVGAANKLTRICLSGWHLRYNNGMWQVEKQAKSAASGNPLSSGIEFKLPGGLGVLFHEDEKQWTVTENQVVTHQDTHVTLPDLNVTHQSWDVTHQDQDVIFHANEPPGGNCKSPSRITGTLTGVQDHFSYGESSKRVSSSDVAHNLKADHPKRVLLRAAVQQIFRHLGSFAESQQEALDDSKHEAICEIVCGPLCTALSDVLSAGVRRKASFIPIKYSPWNIVDKFRAVTSEVNNIVNWVNESRYTSLTESQKFKAFVCECLNIRKDTLYQWFVGVFSQGDKLAKYYDRDGIVFQLSPEQLEGLNLELSRVSFLPFNLHFDKLLKKKDFDSNKAAFAFE